MPPTAQTSGTVAPSRPKPTTIQHKSDESSFTPESGSSGGGRTSESYVMLPPGARSPDPNRPGIDFPIISLTTPPPSRRLSRQTQNKPLPCLPRANNELPKPPTAPPTASQPSLSWAVSFRGFVKAVKWSKSSPQLSKTQDTQGTGRETTDNHRRSLSRAFQAAAKGKRRANPPENYDIAPTPPSKSNTPHEKSMSANAGGVFLVPHTQNAQQQELRPPTPGWMRAVPVDPYELSATRTVMGHRSIHSRPSLDSSLHTSMSPPMADIPVRKSVSEIGHGSLLYATLSPDVSSSSFEHLPHSQLDSPEPSQDVWPQSPVAFPAPETFEERPPTPPRKRLDSLKRAFSFKRSAESKSTPDIPSMKPPVELPVPKHRHTKSVDADRRCPEGAGFVIDENGRARLRRRSTYSEMARSRSSSATRPETNQRHLLVSPFGSQSSFLSTGAPIPSPTPTGDNSKSPVPSTPRRRLTKRKPSQKSRSWLPPTLEVETPKDLEIPNPMETVVIPPPLPIKPFVSTPVAHLPTPETPGLPLSAPPTASAMNTTRALPPIPLPSQLREASFPPPVPPIPAHLNLTSTSAAMISAVNTQTLPSLPVNESHPPSAMLAIRPAMPHRPSLERRASRRRWTLDLAVEDIEEDVLKQELERLRLLGEPGTSSGENAPDSTWSLARKVLLSSREIMLTERTYLNQLMRFLAESEDIGAPTLLLHHLPILISASQAFCNRLSEDPSAWGVSAAFVTVEPVLEQVFVGYCQVVGQIISTCQPNTGQKSGTGSGSKTPTSKSRSSITNVPVGEFGKFFSNKSSEKVGEEREKSVPVSAWQGDPTKSSVPRSKSMPSKQSRRRMSISIGGNSSSTSIASTPTGSTTQLTMPSPTSAERRGGSLASGRAKAITASDIAIAPPQRVTRYVLLYRDLLAGTPLTAPSRPLVQRALDGAMRIAENCDKAQGDISLAFKRKP
ncbi:hypothetical protein CPB86DRAFT_709846 [Serendipita vermifera]|nr:hypothetical protein CPB86DRAFT_709846 [Serendipita vermifera]